MYKRLMAVAATALLIALPLSAQSGDTASFEAVEAASLFSEIPWGVSLSPGGALLAGIVEGRLCIVEIESAEERCAPMPEGVNSAVNGSPDNPGLIWSPDESHLVMTEDVLRMFQDSDIWVFDVAASAFENVTEDGVEGGLIFGEESAGTLLDYMPAWGDSDTLYFFRSDYQPNMEDSSMLLYRYTLSTASLDLMADVTDEIGWLSVYYRPQVSPDGTQMVLPVFAGDPEAPANGLWLIDLVSGEVEQLAAKADIALAIQADEDARFLVPVNPQWVNGGRAVMVTITDYGNQASVPTNFVYIDVATGALTPMIDFSGIPISDLLENPRRPDLPPMPWDSVVNAAGSKLYFMPNPNLGEPAIYALSLPPDGSPPALVAEVEYASTLYTTSPRMGGRRALLGGWLYTLEPAG
ncbi:MAG: hypothetical protein KME04_04915 [Pleurocapsa minor GSE-CHR-MK-17-07R]|jgi:hypothetical protein|nr:hypothetical protein [Pleurocapsa minor GSE-CHR-MK 17-07R]